MLCYQNEKKSDACDNKTDTAELWDRLTGMLIGLARATEGNEDLISPSTDKAVLEGLANLFAKEGCDTISALIAQVQEEKRRLVPNCFDCAAPCGRTNDYDMKQLWAADEDIRSLKVLILMSIRSMAVYACRASALGHTDRAVNGFFYKALYAIGTDWKRDELLAVALEAGEVGVRCVELMNRADGQCGSE